MDTLMSHSRTPCRGAGANLLHSQAGRPYRPSNDVAGPGPLGPIRSWDWSLERRQLGIMPAPTMELRLGARSVVEKRCDIPTACRMSCTERGRTRHQACANRVTG